MHLSAAVLCGAAAAVSALTLPQSLTKRVEHVDLSQFGGFEKITLEQAKADVEANNAAHEAGTTHTTSSGSKAVEAAVTQAGTCTSPATRIEWRSLSDADKTSFIQAIKCLYNLPASGAFAGAGNRYEDLVAVHLNMAGSIHQVAQFLPWHRYYVSIFESLLREECSYTGPMTWWNEELDAGHFGSSPLFTPAYFGSAPAKTSDGQGTCITDGGFGPITIHLNGDHCLSRALDESLTANTNADFVNTCNGNNLYSDMESCSEYGPHAYGHDGIGAVMAGIAGSPSDPTFFLHHTFVDHSWLLWQNADIANRLYQINGCSDTNSPCGANITTSYVLSSQGLRPDVTVNDVMDTQGGYLCYVYDS